MKCNFSNEITHCSTTISCKENPRPPADEVRARMQTERRRDVTAFTRGARFPRFVTSQAAIITGTVRFIAADGASL